jgi:hypothetical protein
MIRAILVATILVSFPVHTIPCWAVRRAVAQYSEAAVVLGASQGRLRRGYRAREAMLKIGCRCFEAMVQAVPDQAVMLDSA